MVDWAEVQHGARIGAGIGAMTGLVPLGVGLALRQPANGIFGWIGCVLGGAIAGFIAAVAMMGLALTRIFRARKSPAKAGAVPDAQSSPGNAETAVADKAGSNDKPGEQASP